MSHEADPTTSIGEQAAHWWVVFHSEGASAADHREFADWVARSPERVEAYLRTAQLQQALESPRLNWPATTAEELIRAAKASPQDVVTLPLGNFTPIRRGKPKSNPRFLWGLAATLLVAISSAWLALARPQQFQTRFGEQRSVLLDDGSRITLNTASKIEVRLRKNHRLIHLIRGEALFEVAHDPARPFDVQTPNAVFRAVGTRFDVDLRPRGTTITVVEGLVAVVVGNAGRKVPTLAASDRLIITPTGPGTPQHDINVTATISWTQRQLVFEHRPLGEIAEEFNRYNRAQIEVASAELREQEMTGVFQSNDAASFIAFLANIPGVQIRDDGRGGHIVTLNDQAPADR